MLRNTAVLILSFLVASCGNYNRDSVPPGPPTGGGPNVATETAIDFATIKSEILDGQCISCHTGRHRAYENYQVVRASAFSMLERMTTGDPSRLMPPRGPRLPAEQIALFREWVEAGAPEFGNMKDSDTDPTPSAPDEGVSFSMVKEKVFKPHNCTACHSQYNDYAAAYKARGGIVSTVSSNAMPFPRRKGLSVEPVSEDAKKILLDWVAQGAPEFAGEVVHNVEPAELQPTWISLRNQVFGPKCILCHNTFGNRGGGRSQSFDTYSKLRNWFTKNPELFKFDPEEGEGPGLFVESILRDPNDPFSIFSPMPFNNDRDDVQATIPRITETELDVINQWIEKQLPYDEEEL